MNTLTIDKAKLLEAYQYATSPARILLEQLYGKAVFEPNIKDKVKSFEDACKVLGIKAKDVIGPVSATLKYIEKQLHAQAKLIIIAQALNQGWLPNWKDNRETKWYPWFEYGASGFGFSHTYYAYSRTGTVVGSRLYYKSDDLAAYAGKQFKDLYNEMLSI